MTSFLCDIKISLHFLQTMLKWNLLNVKLFLSVMKTSKERRDTIILPNKKHTSG